MANSSNILFSTRHLQYQAYETFSRVCHGKWKRTDWKSNQTCDNKDTFTISTA